MLYENVKFKHKKEVFESRLALPESLSEAVELLGEELVFGNFIEGYRAAHKRQVIGAPEPRKKPIKLTVDLTELTSAQVKALREAGLLSSS